MARSGPPSLRLPPLLISSRLSFGGVLACLTWIVDRGRGLPSEARTETDRKKQWDERRRALGTYLGRRHKSEMKATTQSAPQPTAKPAAMGSRRSNAPAIHGDATVPVTNVVAKREPGGGGSDSRGSALIGMRTGSVWTTMSSPSASRIGSPPTSSEADPSGAGGVPSGT